MNKISNSTQSVRSTKLSEKSAKPSVPTYQTLKTELDTVMAELQCEDLDVDEALIQYQRGLELVQQLEHYLSVAENTVTELKAKFTAVADN